MNSVAIYKDALSKVIYQHNVFQEYTSPEWKTLVPMISEELLLDAHSSQKQYEDMLCGFDPIPRPIKTMNRINIKSQGTRDDVPFKVNSDLCAVQIPTYDIYNIKHIMKDIRHIVLEEGGLFHIRNSIEDTNGNMQDIIQYAFAYLPSIGYIIEIQVGHPFAMYTFKVDSIIRDKRLEGSSTSDIVDLWDNGFYSFVKSVILNNNIGRKVTEDDFIQIYPTKEEFKNDTVLMNILHKILLCSL
jgi:hypothetical protein